MEFEKAITANGVFIGAKPPDQDRPYDRFEICARNSAREADPVWDIYHVKPGETNPDNIKIIARNLTLAQAKEKVKEVANKSWAEQIGEKP